MSTTGKISLYLCFFLMICYVSAFAQDQPDEFNQESGETIKGEVIINKNLKIELPPAPRNFEKVPPPATNGQETNTLSYEFKDFQFDLKDIPTRLRVLKLKEEPLTTFTGNYIKLGFGNYFTPYLDLGLNSNANRNGYYGMQLRHLSSQYGPVDKENSGDSHNTINLFGKYTGKQASVSGQLGYNREMVHFYGYDPGLEVNNDTIKQVINDVKAGIEVKSTNVESPLKFGLYGNVAYLKDRYSAKETVARLGVNGSYMLDERLIAKLSLGGTFMGYSNPENINRTLVRMLPSFQFKTGDLTINAGIRVAYSDDTLDNKSSTRLFPVANIAYQLTANISAYGGIEGDVDEVSYHALVKENPYLAAHVGAANTIKNMELKAGLRGNLIEYLAFDAGIKVGTYKNMYFFLNDPVSPNFFDVVYDKGTTNVFNAFATLSYNRSKDMGSELQLSYSGYGTDKIDEAWQKPKFEFNFNFWYLIYDKVRVSTDIYALSGIKSLNYQNGEPIVVKLDPALDVNLNLTYFLSKRYSVFLNFNNIFNSKYSYYYRYPSRGLLVMVGLSANF